MKNQWFPGLRRGAPGLSGFGQLIMVASSAALLCLLLLLLNQPARAQSDPVRPVDTTAFPDLTVQIPCSATVPLSALTFTLREDELTRPLRKAPTVEAVYLKTQTIFLLDLIGGSEDLIRPIGDTLKDFFDYYSATVPANVYDQFTFAAFAPAGDGETLAVIEPPTRQLGTLVSNVYQLDLQAPKKTALTALMANALSSFDKNTPARRTIVVFSDGADLTKDKKLIVAAQERFLQQVDAQDVRIDTIFIKTSPGNPYTLEQMATTTGGAYVANLGNSSAVNQLLQQLVAPQAICTLVYRTKQVQPRQISVQTAISDVVVATTLLPIPPVNVLPPVVALDARLLNSDIILGQPPFTASLPLDLRWSFTNYPNRDIARVTFEFVGQDRVLPYLQPIRQPATQPLPLAIPLAELGPGTFSLHVIVQDELGLEGRAIAPFRLVAPTPTYTATPTPSPTPTPTLTPTPTPTTVLSLIEVELSKVDPNYSRVYLAIAALLLVLVLGGISYWLTSVLLKLRNERANSQLPFLARRVQPAPAVLYRIQMRPELPLRQVLKLERTVNLPDDLIIDAKPSVRARHLEKVRQSIATQARIERKGQTEFYLGYPPTALLSGSLTLIQFESNGAVEEVAREALPPRLKHNDIIYLSPTVRYRFIDLTRSPQDKVSDAGLANSAESGKP